MKKNSSFLFFLLIMLSFRSIPSFGQCKVSQIVDECKIKIDPAYLYDGFKLSNLIMDANPKKLDIEFIALKDQKYKLYICNSGFTEEVMISIFKEENDSERTEVITTSTLKEKNFEIDIQKAGKYTVEYSIPSCENAEYGMVKEECMILLISFQEK